MSLRLHNPMSGLVWLACLMPTLLVSERHTRFFLPVCAVLGLLILLSRPSPWEARRPSFLAAQMFFLLQVLVLASYAYAAAFNGIQTSPGDFVALTRPLLLGIFACYVIRHFDAHVLTALDVALPTAIYTSPLLQHGPQAAFACTLTLCWLLFFSRLRPRLRALHAAAAALMIFSTGAPTAWAAALLVAAVALAARLYGELGRRSARFSKQLSFAAFLVLLIGASACLRHAPPMIPSLAMTALSRSPLFGWGPAETALLAVAPGQYLRWALAGGAIGAIFILLSLALATARLLEAAEGDFMRGAGVAAFIGALAVLLAYGAYFEADHLVALTAFVAAGIHAEDA